MLHIGFRYERKGSNMMKKALSTIMAMVLLVWATASLAEQLPSPAMQTTIKADVTLREGSTASESDFEVWLEADPEMSAMLLTEMQDYIATEKLAHFFDDESWTLAAEYLPENFDMEKLMLAELYSISAAHYDLEYGDVDAAFEFAADYEDDAILLAMVGVVINEAAVEGDLPELQWFPIQATVHEGRVVLTIPQQALELISDDEPAYFVLLQEQA